jgi:putative addiction module component (TIGR02574 family)
MTTTLKKITDSLKALPQAERLEVADSLYSSAIEDSPEAVERAWSDEVKRRLEEYRAGKAVVHTEKQVHARIQKVLNETRRRVARSNR